MYNCRDKKLDLSGKPLIMGILNVTPDSFSDGGNYTDVSKALSHAFEMVKQGADIIDIGGESTRPGYTQISSEEEIERIVPVIKAIKENIDVALSVDTYKADVAKAALEAGCDIVNDVTGLYADPDMAKVIAEYKAGAILMFNMRNNGEDENADVISRAETELQISVEKALEAGIESDRIMLDPGIGFGTTREQDMILTDKVDKISLNGRYPVLYACSRKRMTAEFVFDGAGKEDRDTATAVLGLEAIKRGAAMVRVHNVAAMKSAIDVYYSFLERSNG